MVRILVLASNGHRRRDRGVRTARACTPRTTYPRIEGDALRLKEVVGEDRYALGTAVRPLSLEYLDQIAFRPVVVRRWIVRVRFHDEQASACIDRCPYRGDDVGVLRVQGDLQAVVAEPRICRVA